MNVYWLTFDFILPSPWGFIPSVLQTMSITGVAHVFRSESEIVEAYCHSIVFSHDNFNVVCYRISQLC